MKDETGTETKENINLNKVKIKFEYDENSTVESKPEKVLELCQTEYKDNTIILEIVKKDEKDEKSYIKVEDDNYLQVMLIKETTQENEDEDLIKEVIESHTALNNFKYFAGEENLKKKEIELLKIEKHSISKNITLIRGCEKSSLKNQQKEYICNNCNYKTFNRSTFIDHVRTHIRERLFKCNFCNYSSNRKSTLNKHRMNIHYEKTSYKKKKGVYKCLQCDVSYKYHYSLTRHVRSVHGNERPFKCTVCSFRAASRYIIRNHIKTHTEGRLHQCSLCNSSYKRSDVLKKHILSAHTEVNKKFECEDCHSLYATKKGLQSHLQKNLDIDKPKKSLVRKCYSFKCPFCNLAFPYRCRLKCHMLHHTGEKPFKCIECGLCFFTHTLLKYHVYTHTKKLAFKCRSCVFSTFDHSIFVKHKTTICEGKLFNCESCNYGCNIRKHMVNHLKKNYRCAHCDFSTKCRTALVHHLKGKNCRSKWC